MREIARSGLIDWDIPRDISLPRVNYRETLNFSSFASHHAFPCFSSFSLSSPLPLTHSISLSLSLLDINPVAYFPRRRQPEGFRKYFARLFSTRLWREAPKDSQDNRLKGILSPSSDIVVKLIRGIYVYNRKANTRR